MTEPWPPQPAAVPLLQLTESQIFKTLRAFLLRVVPAGVPVLQGQVNRVAEPHAANFIIVWPLSQERLSTNRVDYFDNVVTASVAGTVLSVTATAKLQTPLSAGMLLVDKTGLLAAGTVVGAQLTGSLGGTGTYSVTPTQTVASETMYAGTRADVAATKLGVQIDVHGPRSGDLARVLETLFFSEYGVASFASLEVAPLYCENPRQMPFTNDQQQVENRWVVDAFLQINPSVNSPQLFAEEVEVNTIEAAVVYTGP